MWRGKSLRGGGGAERRFLRLINYFGSKDIFLATNYEWAADLRKTGLPFSESLILHPPKPVGIPEFNQWLMSLVVEKEPDIVHLVLFQKSLIPFYFWLKKARNQFGTKVVSSMVRAKFLPTGKPSFFDVQLARYIWKMSALIDVLYPSASKSKWLLPYKDKIRITPCSFTDYETFVPAKEKSNLVSYVGRFIPGKAPFLFVESVKALLSNAPRVAEDWTFVMLGEGPLKEKVRRYVISSGLNDKLQLETAYSSADLLSKSKIYASLYLHTNYPSQSLLEAMATENAIVVTNDEDTRRLIDENCGILVGRRPETIASSFSQLMTNDALREQLGKNARKKVLSTQRIEVFAEYMEEFWREALAIDDG